MKPWVSDTDLDIYVGDVRDVLRELPDESVHCVVTSPPYWGLRDYGTGAWEGGDPDCDHTVSGQVQDNKALGAITTGQRPGAPNVCRRCGANRVDRQIGLESTPEEYVQNMVEVFRAVHRVLRSDGTLWLNLGDSYNSNPAGRNPGGFQGQQLKDDTEYDGANPRHVAGTRKPGTGKSKVTSLKPKDLIGVPWLVAFALQADGWWLRSDTIWAKKNGMPESVTDRPARSHEYVFLLTKSARYFYDAEAVKEPAEWLRWGDQTNEKYEGTPSSTGWIGAKPKRELTWEDRKALGEPMRHGVSGEKPPYSVAGGKQTRNMRDVWHMATQPYPEAHFATFPEELPKRCILAGSPVGGVVMDPFGGAGTTAKVARDHGRRSILIELNPKYADLAAKRLQQLSLLG